MSSFFVTYTNGETSVDVEIGGGPRLGSGKVHVSTYDGYAPPEFADVADVLAFADWLHTVEWPVDSHTPREVCAQDSGQPCGQSPAPTGPEPTEPPADPNPTADSGALSEEWLRATWGLPVETVAKLVHGWRIVDAHNLLDWDEYQAWRAAYDRSNDV